MMTNGKETKHDHLQLLGQGTYGCVYRPAINCKTLKPISKNYVSKIQIKDDLSQTEIDFGKRIVANVRNYSFFFAPILETCDLRVSQIDDEQLNQCEVVEKNQTKPFSSNKLDYVGKQTFGPYFETSLSNATTPKKTRQFLMKLVDTHIYLLHSVERLNNQNILHLDIKENNVMYHEKNHVFVLIDFGLSVDSTSLDLSNYTKDKNQKPFGILVDSYIPWNLDIILLSYIARQIQPKNEKGKYAQLEKEEFDKTISNTTDIKRIVTKFIKDNVVFRENGFKENEIAEFEKKYHTYIQTWKGKTWKDAWNELREHHKSWDAYGINVMVLRLLMNMNITQFIDEDTKEKPAVAQQNQILDTVRLAFAGNTQRLETIHFFKQYLDFLKTSILTIPSDRPYPLDCISKIKNLFDKIPKGMMNRWSDYMEKRVTSPANLEKVRRNINEDTLQNIESDNHIRKQFADIKIVAQ